MRLEPTRAPARALPWAIALAGALLACGPEHDAREEHAEEEHGHAGEHAPKTDPHHVAEARTDCEEDVALPPEALARYGIEVAPARATALVPTVSAPGHLAFPQSAVARVGSAVAGRVSEVRVRWGDTVAVGDALLVVESPELGQAQSEYLQRRTESAAAGPALELAQQAFERARELHERVQGIALAEVEMRKAELEAAKARRSSAEAGEAAAMNRLLLLGWGEEGIRALAESGRIEPRIAVRAPIAGRVVDLAAALGELVSPAKDRLAVIGDPRVLWAIAEVSESRIAEVALGAPARVRIPALGGPERAGRVSAVAGVLEAATRTAEVRVEVENQDGALLPGMFIEVEIESTRSAGEPVLAVPDAAVLTVEGRPSVFVPLEPGGSVFCRHPVEIGAAVGEHVPVLAGLAAGELVVVAGAFRLKAEAGKGAVGHDH